MPVVVGIDVTPVVVVVVVDVAGKRAAKGNPLIIINTALALVIARDINK